MQAIICPSNIVSVVNKIQDFLEKGRTIKGIRVVDITDSEAVILIDESPISQDKADGWWQCYQSMMSGN